MSHFTRLSPTDTRATAPEGQRVWHWLGMGLTGLALCAGAFWVGAKVVKPWWSAASLAPAAPAAPLQALSFVPPAALPAPRATPRPVAPVPAVRASLVMDGRELARTGERLALPSGARFQVALQAQRSGTVRLEAVNPEGKTTLVWAAHLDAGERTVSPMLRLDGGRGMESLRVVSADGSVQRWAILHV